MYYPNICLEENREKLSWGQPVSPPGFEPRTDLMIYPRSARLSKWPSRDSPTAGAHLHESQWGHWTDRNPPGWQIARSYKIASLLSSSVRGHWGNLCDVRALEVMSRAIYQTAPLLSTHIAGTSRCNLLPPTLSWCSEDDRFSWNSVWTLSHWSLLQWSTS
jgi:hypothetical protein